MHALAASLTPNIAKVTGGELFDKIVAAGRLEEPQARK